MHRIARGLAALIAASVLLLAGCATGGYGGYGGYGGGDPGGYGQPQYGALQGTVEGVDAYAGRLQLVVGDPRGGRAQRVALRYDQRTRLRYLGREYPVEGLERGDVVRVDAVDTGRDLYARTIEVVRNVRDGYGGSVQGDTLRGAVAWVDSRARQIRLDGAGHGGGVVLSYDGRTTVEYQGRLYRPENLQRGDQVRVQARQSGYNRWLAERIVVERSAGSRY
jgi:hypothetical protein